MVHLEAAPAALMFGPNGHLNTLGGDPSAPTKWDVVNLSLGICWWRPEFREQSLEDLKEVLFCQFENTPGWVGGRSVAGVVIDYVGTGIPGGFAHCLHRHVIALARKHNAHSTHKHTPPSPSDE